MPYPRPIQGVRGRFAANIRHFRNSNNWPFWVDFHRLTKGDNRPEAVLAQGNMLPAYSSAFRQVGVIRELLAGKSHLMHLYVVISISRSAFSQSLSVFKSTFKIRLTSTDSCRLLCQKRIAAMENDNFRSFSPPPKLMEVARIRLLPNRTLIALQF